ncbi:unnamed protein product [Pylaiella littoralis]
MRAAASLILRSARLPRCPLPPLLSSITVWGPGGHQAPTAAERSAASATSLAWFSSRSRKTGSTAALPDGVGDVTKIFGDSSFWEGEYASQYANQETRKPFEWFLPYEGGLRDHLLIFLKSMPSCTRLLHVGCGTSEVGPKLAQEPDLSLHVTDADNSPSAVRLMKQRHAAVDNYTCRETDVLNLKFPDGSFDAVVDKGTLDALLCRSVKDARDMVTEMHRVLTPGGIYVQVTAEDPEARLELLLGSGSSSKRKEKKEEQQQPWARSLFKELGALGEGGESSYFMYVLVK